MPIKKRLSARRSEFVYTDNGVLVVKTPPACTKWPHAFRIRIVRDYVKPRKLLSANEFERRFANDEQQQKLYKVQERRVRVLNTWQTLSNGNIVVLTNEVHAVDRGDRLILQHSDAAMRVLMVYSFLTAQDIGGVPKLHIAPIDDE